MSEKEDKYFCEKCKFSCLKQSNFNIHCSTQKHINNLNKSEIELQNNIKNSFICNCGKIYSHASGLSRHKVNCK